MEIVMPRLSDTMEEGTILQWLKRDGEHVARGEELVEIETDKAAMVYESDQEGTLQILAREGDTLAVGETIARIGTHEASQEQAQAQAPAQPAGAQPAEAQPDEARPAPARSAASHPAEEPHVAAPSTSTDNGGSTAGERVKASPLARRIAREHGLDLRTIAGSGPGGRIVEADVRGATAQGAGATAPPKETLAERVAGAKGETTLVELTRTQRTIARRMAESKATIPDFTLQIEIDMEACAALRSELKRLSPEQAPTYNDMLVKACALALREHPRVNSGYRDGRLELHGRVNVGVAVAVGGDSPTASALVVPTLFDADLKSLGEIARETRALADRVRAGTITPPELGGGTFTVSNLGMYGVRSFTAIVNPPQAAILAVGSLAARAVVHEGAVVARRTLAATLACDHRALYGADAAGFLARVRELLERPASLTL